MDARESLRGAENLRFRFQMNHRLRLECLAAVSKVFRDFDEPIADELLSSVVFALPQELISNGAAVAVSASGDQGQQKPAIPPEKPKSEPQPGIPPEKPKPGVPPEKPKPGVPPEKPKPGVPPEKPKPEQQPAVPPEEPLPTPEPLQMPSLPPEAPEESALGYLPPQSSGSDSHWSQQ